MDYTISSLVASLSLQNYRILLAVIVILLQDQFSKARIIEEHKRILNQLDFVRLELQQLAKVLLKDC